jgi:acyl-CoA synthetase (NDP forming)
VQSPVARAEHEAKELLRSAGIAVPALHVAADAVVAADLAEQLGFPVVLKMSAPGLVHKSDIGAVRVGLGSWAEVIDAASDLLAISGLPSDAELVVEQMAPAGVEMFVSAHRQGVQVQALLAHREDDGGTAPPAGPRRGPGRAASRQAHRPRWEG